MIVDTSAVMAILFGESGAKRYDETLAEAPRCRMSVVNFLEAAIVLESRSGHPAGLNLGDCFAYALAEATREPLLFKGRHFALTDIEAA